MASAPAASTALTASARDSFESNFAFSRTTKLMQLGIFQQVGDAAYGKTFMAKDILAAIGEGDE